jgi:membrane protease subunit HflK
MFLVFISQSFVTIKDHEVGFVYRFGKLNKVLRNGIHFTFPFPIETSEKFSLTRDRKLSGKSFLAADRPLNSEIPKTLRPTIEGYLYTGDQNIVHANYTLIYRVDDSSENAIRNYFIIHKNSEKILKLCLENAIVKSAGTLTTDQVLFDTPTFRSKTLAILKQNILKNKLGIALDSLSLTLAPIAPVQTKAAFDAIILANNNSDTLHNKALAYKIKIINEAKSQRDNLISEAKSETYSRVIAAQAAADNFKVQIKEFNKNPALIYRTLHEETLSYILQHVDEKFIVDKENQRQIRILIGRDLSKKKKGDKKNGN